MCDSVSFLGGVLRNPVALGGRRIPPQADRQGRTRRQWDAVNHGQPDISRDAPARRSRTASRRPSFLLRGPEGDLHLWHWPWRGQSSWEPLEVRDCGGLLTSCQPQTQQPVAAPLPWEPQQQQQTLAAPLPWQPQQQQQTVAAPLPWQPQQQQQTVAAPLLWQPLKQQQTLAAPLPWQPQQQQQTLAAPLPWKPQ